MYKKYKKVSAIECIDNFYGTRKELFELITNKTKNYPKEAKLSFEVDYGKIKLYIDYKLPYTEVDIIGEKLINFAKKAKSLQEEINTISAELRSIEKRFIGLDISPTSTKPYARLLREKNRKKKDLEGLESVWFDLYKEAHDKGFDIPCEAYNFEFDEKLWG